MRILYCKTFGIGNAVMAVPAVTALVNMGHQVDVLVGSTDDDYGARDVFKQILPMNTYVDRAPGQYDLAILAIPYDGRWRNGVHFSAAKVMDGRTRPDPTTTGLVSWEKHEVEYQMDNVRELGYDGPTPPCNFRRDTVIKPSHLRVYLGLGFKKDEKSFWSIKHWGNENYAELVRLMLRDDPRLEIWTTGDILDLTKTFADIYRKAGLPGRFHFRGHTMRDLFWAAANCDAYVGNDTGAMHVAASFNLPCVAVMNMEKSRVKNHPWCDKWTVLEGFKHSPTPEQVFIAYKELMA